MSGRVVSVNVGAPRAIANSGKPSSGIDKRPVDGAVAVGELGLDGDHIADTRNHGGVFQAVYAYAREDADRWSHDLGRALPPGSFGENLTTEGVAVTDAVVGERWAIGSAVLQVTVPRIPCTVFAAFWGVPDLIRRFTARAWPGAYLSVVEPGDVRAGDEVRVVHRPDHAVTIGLVFRALTLEPELLARLLDAPELPPSAQQTVRRRLGTATGG